MPAITPQVLLHRLPSQRDLNQINFDLESLNIYFPASSAGAPPISPAFGSHWNDTSSAVRVVGRLGKKYSTSFEDVAINPSTTQRKLVRQFVIPLQGVTPVGHSAILFDIDRPASYIYGRKPTGSAGSENVALETASRVVNASGTTISSIPDWPAGHSFTATITADSYTITSSGHFSRSDIGAYIVCSNGFVFPNTIVEVIDTNTAVLQYAYSAPESGSQTVTLISPGGLDTNANGDGPPVSGSFSAISGENASGNVGGSVGRFSDNDYMVIEIGLGLGSSTVSNTLRFGDPSDDIVVYNGSTSSGSTGGVIQFYPQSPLIF